ncbi:MAG: hypothetical protein HZB70_02140 [Candidatus Berkelbacteria bacterium]|nr:MAG: hypothetical protein HZB70_02140 [Candidatus Berkelbacteria bacterium]QQG51883.1 MAG: hypothetical protein HY845_00855 [Candidatus Berkelbacteria bacterium]
MEPVYLEPDEEITSVIDKLTKAGGGKIGIVVPKNSTLFQSLVNLKLLAKQAKESNKEVVIITGNKVGQRLAAQVGIEAYASLGTVREVPKPSSPTVQPATTKDEALPDGTPIHRYVPPTVIGGEKTEAPEQPVEAPIEEAIEAEPPQPAPEPVAVEKEETVQEITPSEPVQIIPQDRAPAEELPAIISRTPTARREFNFQMPWKSLIAAGILLILAFGITYVLLPKATVTVTLPAKAVAQTLTLNAKTVADSEATSVVGNLLVAEKSLTKAVTATGKKDIGTKATGTVPFKNCEDSNAHAVAAGSKVTASGKTFTTNSAATIPAGSFSGGGSVCNSSSVNIAITASEAGEGYNLANVSFAVNGLSSRISGTGSTSGGTTKQVTVLTKEDVDKAYAELEKQALDEAKAELTTKAAGQTLLDGAINQNIKERSVDKKVDDQTDTATAKLVAELSAIVFDKEVAKAKLKEALEAQVEEGKRLEVPEGSEPAIAFKSYSEDKTVLSFEIAGGGYGVADISKNDISSSIRHKTSSAAEAALKDNYEASEVKISMSPSWWIQRLPILKQAISVEYGFNESVTAPAVVPTPVP